MRGASVSLRSSGVNLLCRQELTTGGGLTDLGSLLSGWIMRHQSNRHQGALLTARNQEVTITVTTSEIRGAVRRFVRWLIEHGV